MTTVDDAIDAALTTALAADGRTITYRRGANTATLNAIRTRSHYTTTTADGLMIRVQLTDYLIRAPLTLAGADTSPQAGDTIEDGTDTYAVVDTPEGPYRRTHQLIRIHTRLR